MSAPFTVAFVSDLKPHDDTPLCHAVALAAHMSARLVVVNATSPGAEMTPAPDLAEVAARIGVRAPAQSEIIRHVCCDDPVDTSLNALESLAPDVVVIGSAQRSGAGRFLHGSVSEGIARNWAGPTLIVPHECEGLVQDGRVAPEMIVLPAGDASCARSAAATVERVFGVADPKPDGVLLCVGHEAPLELNTIAPVANWRFEREEGDLVARIVAEEATVPNRLVVMATRGQDSLGDALRGSVTERVMRKVSSPLLICRADS